MSTVIDENSIYKFTVKDVNGDDVSLSKYKGNVVLIVNVASGCGLTDSNYKQLKELLDKYNSKGFRLALFPCNQFGGQESECAINVKEKMTSKYEIEPDFYDKIDVNGKNEDPLYTFLKNKQGGTILKAIKWNFTKFLINKKGHVIKRYGPTLEPKDITKDIVTELAAPE